MADKKKMQVKKKPLPKTWAETRFFGFGPHATGFNQGPFYSPPNLALEIVYEQLRDLKEERTKKARDARRADDIQNIIDTCAHKFWDQKSSFKNNAHGTAINIHKTVRKEISKLKKIPRGWEPHEKDPISVKKEIDRITKRVERVIQFG